MINVLLVFSLLLLFTNFGCVTEESPEFYQTTVVTEKSKIKEPQWIKRQIGVLSVDQYELSSVDFKQSILNLPVGIRTAQKEAKDAHFELMKDYLLADVNKIIQTNSISFSDLDFLKNDIGIVLNQSYDDNFKVKDIYYEKVVDQSKQAPEESYRVFTLIIYPLKELNPVYQSLARKWGQSRNPNLKKLAKFIKR